MSDLIDRQTAIAALERDILDPPVLHDAIATIRELPSAQPERKKGEWIIHNVLGFNCHPTNRYFAECSECGTLTREWRGNLFPPRLRFCTNCGAMMDVK